MKAWGSKKIIRREELPPLEPWHVDQFSGSSVQRPHVLVPEPSDVVSESPAEPEIITTEELPAQPDVVEPEMVPMIDAAELEEIRQSAHDAGYQAGFEAGQQAGLATGEAAGREAGYAAGFESGQQQGLGKAQADLERFAQLYEQLSASVASYETQLAQPILDIAVAVARQVIRTSLALEPEKVLAVVREAVASLPDLQGPLRMELHPDDLALVQALFAGDVTAAQWRLEANPDMERGGCRINHATVELDVTLPTRWRRIVAALGSHEPWQTDDANS